MLGLISAVWGINHILDGNVKLCNAKLFNVRQSYITYFNALYYDGVYNIVSDNLIFWHKFELRWMRLILSFVFCHQSADCKTRTCVFVLIVSELLDDWDEAKSMGWSLVEHL